MHKLAAERCTYQNFRYGEHNLWHLLPMASNIDEPEVDRLDAQRAPDATPPAESPWDTLVGPFFDSDGAQARLGVSHQAMHEKVSKHALLACPTADGVTVYPTWQFLPNGATIPALAEVLSTLAAGTDDAWTIALWMQARSDLLDGHRPSDWLRKGGDPHRVLVMARDTAAQWKV